MNNAAVIDMTMSQDDITQLELFDHFVREEKTIWYGPEVEYTRFFGKPTMCIRGVPPIEDIDEALGKFPHVSHLYFGGPYDYKNPAGPFQNEEEIQTIESYLLAGNNITVAVEPNQMHGNILDFFKRHAKNKNLCIFILTKVPHLDVLSDRIDLKLDDPFGVGGNNGGVWVISAKEFMRDDNYTPWDIYDVDFLIK